MDQPQLSLLQTPDSPLRQVIGQALEQKRISPLFNLQSDPLPDEAASAVCCWVWDLSGFTSQEIAELGVSLSGDQSGVMVASAEAGDDLLRAVDLSQALQVVVAPESAEQVAAALTLTGNLHNRVIELIDSREKVRRDIVERMAVEEAKAILMVQHGLSEPMAMRRLQEISRRNNQKLAVTAAKIVDSQRKGGNGG